MPDLRDRASFGCSRARRNCLHLSLLPKEVEACLFGNLDGLFDGPHASFIGGFYPPSSIPQALTPGVVNMNGQAPGTVTLASPDLHPLHPSLLGYFCFVS